MRQPIDPYDIRGRLPHFETLVAKFRRDSLRARAELNSELDIRYGATPRASLDLFLPADVTDPLPVHIFVHGGYWRAFDKSDYSFVAHTITAAGAIAVIVDYDLMPGVRMSVLVDQVRAAARWVRDHIAGFGGNPEAVSVSGHSAGAHLASYLRLAALDESGFPDLQVGPMMLLSGIYDLAPIAQSHLQPALCLTAEEIAHWSPLRAKAPKDMEAMLLVGELETAPFHEDAGRLATLLKSFGAAVTRHVQQGADHMTIVGMLGQPGSEIAEYLKATIGRSR